MNLQVSAQAQERLLSKLSSMAFPRAAASALFERHMLVRYPKGAELFTMGSPADVVFAVLTGLVESSQLAGRQRPGAGRARRSRRPGRLCRFRGRRWLAIAVVRGHRADQHHRRAVDPPSNCGSAQEPRAGSAAQDHRGDQFDVVVDGLPYATFLGMSLRKRLEIVLANWRSDLACLIRGELCSCPNWRRKS